MAGKMVRIDEETWEVLKELSQEMDEPMQRVVARSVEVLRRQHIVEATNAAYAALQANPQTWEEVQEERREWEATLADGLDEK